MDRLEYLRTVLQTFTKSTAPIVANRTHVVSAESGKWQINEQFTIQLETVDAIAQDSNDETYRTPRPMGGLRGILTIWGPRTTSDPICEVRAYTEAFTCEMKAFHQLLIFPDGTIGHSEAMLIASILPALTAYVGD